jgi:hypothetical protein
VIGILKERFWLILGALIGCQLISFLAVFKLFAQPRQFKGDFYAAMFDPLWWDGTGLFYGPMFVFERWLVDAFPTLFTITFFSIHFLVVIFATFSVALKTVNADKNFILFGLLMCCANSYLYYSYSVVANPNMLELFFLVLMWWAMSRKYFIWAHLFFALAVITKLVPVVLLPIILFNFNPYGLLILVLIMIGSIVLVAVGQGESVSSILEDLIPASAGLNPQSEQFLGLSNAIIRSTRGISKTEFEYALSLSSIAIALMYILVIYNAYRFHTVFKTFSYEVSVAYCFAIFMCLLPMMHLNNVHRHTFLFLAPVWIAMRFVAQSDANWRRGEFFSRVFLGLFCLYSILPLYFLDVFPVSQLYGLHLGETKSTLIMLTEPIYINLILLASVACYGWCMSRDVRLEQIKETSDWSDRR